MNALSERVAIVTGAGRGIGAATALKLAREGAHVVINDIQVENARAIASEVEKLGRKSLVSSHDVSSHSAAAALAEETRSKFGRIDILVNNAGITRDAMLHKLTEENWDEVIRVNLKGPFNMGQSCAKVMIEQKFGRIINISSVSWLGNVGQTNYLASKAGLVGMTSTWALELARHGITANAIAPGFIETHLVQQMPPEIITKLVNRIPLKRMGKPEDIAYAVAFLASDEAGYISGQCLHVDGALSVGIGPLG